MNYARIFNAQNYVRVSSAFGSVGFITGTICGVKIAPEKYGAEMIILSPILFGIPFAFVSMSMWPGMIIAAPYYFYNKKL